MRTERMKRVKRSRKYKMKKLRGIQRTRRVRSKRSKRIKRNKRSKRIKRTRKRMRGGMDQDMDPNMGGYSAAKEHRREVVRSLTPAEITPEFISDLKAQVEVDRDISKAVREMWASHIDKGIIEKVFAEYPGTPMTKENFRFIFDDTCVYFISSGKPNPTEEQIIEKAKSKLGQALINGSLPHKTA